MTMLKQVFLKHCIITNRKMGTKSHDTVLVYFLKFGYCRVEFFVSGAVKTGEVSKGQYDFRSPNPKFP